ncbi:MAG: exodeoxyribonuclease I, partial [Lysobacteraceae bacterium]
LSDVYATLGMARKLRDAQPRLWDYALKLRDKRFAASLLDTIALTPVLHVSQRYPASRLCAAPVLPLARHPRIDNRIIVFDLEGDPDALLQLEAGDIADRLYTPAADLPEGEKRIPLKEVHLNRSPALVAWSHLRKEDFERLHFDKGAVEATAERLRPFATQLAEKMRQVFGDERAHAKSDVDASLYDGFIADGDKRRMAEVRATPPEHLDKREFGFKDPRLQELLFRYRARNWPGTLTQPEQLQWDGYRRQRLVDDAGWSEATFDSYEAEIATLRLQHAGDGARQSLLDHLQTWGQDLRTELAV